MARYFYAWTPLVLLVSGILLTLPWLGLIALMVFALVALPTLALVLVVAPYMLIRAIAHSLQARTARPRPALARVTH